MTTRWKIIAGTTLLLGILATVGWWQRTPLLCWYYLRGLDTATEETQESWVTAVVRLEEAAVPGLLQRLRQPDPTVCKNAETALSALARHWGQPHDQTNQLAEQLASNFDEFSIPGQEATLEWHLVALQIKPPPTTPLCQCATKVLSKASRHSENGIQSRTLLLAGVLLEHQPSPPCQQLVRTLIERELHNPKSPIRVRAVHLTLHAHFQHDTELLKQVVPLLRDSEAVIRRAALLAVGSSRKLISEEQMLPLLHDTDGHVRQLCETALRQRGLHDDHILLGRLISAPSPAQRLRIVHHLPFATEVDHTVWLLRLSQDRTAAVRAAAVRLGGTSGKYNFRERLEHMARNDPSETVRQLAVYYLGHK